MPRICCSDGIIAIRSTDRGRLFRPDFAGAHRQLLPHPPTCRPATFVAEASTACNSLKVEPAPRTLDRESDFAPFGASSANASVVLRCA